MWEQTLGPRVSNSHGAECAQSYQDMRPPEERVGNSRSVDNGVRDKSQPIPHPQNAHHNARMSFTLAPFAFALSQAVQLHAQVRGQGELMGRPEFVIKAVAARLRAGVRRLEAFLRRILILMALEMEHDLVAVWHPENLARTKDVKKFRLKRPFLKIYPMPDRPYYSGFEPKFAAPCPKLRDTDAALRPPVRVPIGRWMAQLDYLQALIHDPVAKARRLAFSLARSRHGILMAPPCPPRLLRRCGTEISALHDAMAYQIMEKSRNRPPPLPPPKRGPKPMITVFY
jgi:hypothetical protein